MRKINLFFLIFLLFGSSTLTAFADLYMGARPMGMGSAFTAISDDANAVYWNPAGLALSGGRKFTFMHGLVQNVPGLRLDYAAYSQNINSSAGIGFSWLNISATLEQGENAETSEFSQNVYVLGGGIEVVEGYLSAGFGVKRFTIDSSIDGGAGLGFDLGMIYRPFKNDYFILGGSVKDIAAEIKNERYPCNFRAGAASVFWEERIKAAVDLSAKKDIAGNEDYSLKYHAGIEITPIKNISIRGGYDNGNPAFGGSIYYSWAGLDYAFLKTEALGSFHRISLSLSFGPDGEMSENKNSQKNAKKSAILTAPARIRVTSPKKGVIEAKWGEVDYSGGVKGYNLYYSVAGGKGYKKINSKIMTKNSIKVKAGAFSGKTIYIVVRAVGDDGEEGKASDPARCAVK